MTEIIPVKLGLQDGKTYPMTMLQGFSRYLCFGLPPGSFEGAVYTGDHELASARAHNSLRPRPSKASGGWAGSADQDVVANLIEFVQINLPPEALGGPLKQMAWCRKGGLGKDPEQRLLFKLGFDTKWVDEALREQGLFFNWSTGEYGQINAQES